MKNKECIVCGSKKLTPTGEFYFCNNCDTNFVMRAGELIAYANEPQIEIKQPLEKAIRMSDEEILELYQKQGILFIDATIKPHAFGWTLQQLKAGKMLTRAIWKDTCIFLIKGRTVEYNTFQGFKNNACQAFDPPQDVEIMDHIDAKHNGKYITGVVLQQYDLLAEDWEIYNTKK